MNVKRLKDVIEAVRKAPNRKFRMTSWACGTTACAIGHYCIRHPRSPLKLVGEPHEKYKGVELDKYGGLDAYEAIAVFFGIYSVDAQYLFSPSEYSRPTRVNVIRRIEQFIRDAT